MKSKQTILIVDDIEENIDILTEFLQEYTLLTALNGKDALKLVESEDIDLLLLDIMMPDMDGFEVCKIIKNNRASKNIPIIFLSAKGEDSDIAEGFKLGAVDYITKPFNPAELIARVNTHLKLRAYEKDLEKRVEYEIQQNKEKQQLIHQQSKQAALGELLMLVAHQWQQPLATLGSINFLEKTKIESGQEISKEEQLHIIDRYDDLVEFMSDTVDTFKNFYQPSFDDEQFSLTDSLQQVLNISHATLSYHNIDISISSHEKNETYGNSNEFNQVVFSIINNARDIFKFRDIQNPKIHIEVQDQMIVISDNAGGIDDNIITDIFMPYISSTGGTGIGMYIVKELVEKNNGIISVKNSKEGAVFTIEYLTMIED